MKLDKKDKYEELGMFGIHRNKLYYDDILLIKYWKSRGPVKGVKQMPISSNLKECLIHLLENSTLSEKLVEELSLSDCNLMEQILRRSKIIGQVGFKRPKKNLVIFELRHKLYLIQLSMQAGNEGVELNKDAIDLLTQLYALDDITSFDYYALKESLS